MDEMKMKQPIDFNFEESPKQLDNIEEFLSDLDWQYAKYKELRRMYKLICGVINRSEGDSCLSAANVTSLWANVFDRMVNACESFREQKKNMQDVVLKKYSPAANLEFLEKVKGKFSVEDFGNDLAPELAGNSGA
jgi:hypothetical protein